MIPYEKYVLPNGLTLIVHEDHSDPIVHVDVTYHVGSAREEFDLIGRQNKGFPSNNSAHLSKFCRHWYIKDSLPA